MSDDGAGRPWFRRKTFGYGMTPATWQGWLSLGLLIGLMLATTLLADPAVIKPRSAGMFVVAKATFGLGRIALPAPALFAILAGEVAAFYLVARRMSGAARPLD